jgi:alkylated DNA repair dioxygenase AlkB
VILELSHRAVEAALTKARASTPPLPVPFNAHPKGLSPPEQYFTVLANLYPPGWGTIAGHSDTTEEDAKKDMCPVVSFSVGDSANFVLEPAGQDPITLTLRSGDAILFGGDSRLIKHGIPKPPMAGPRPSGLGMVPGRLNITVRVL